MRARPERPLRFLGGTTMADDWDCLFDALATRLRRLAAAVNDDPAAPRLMQADLMDCVLALQGLHHNVGLEVGRRRRLELEVFDARIARARAVWPRPAALSFDGADDAGGAVVPARLPAGWTAASRPPAGARPAAATSGRLAIAGPAAQS